MTTPKWPVLLLGALAAACTPAPPPGPPPPAPPGATEPYRATGTEPFWSITVADGRMTFASPDGPGFSVPAPEPRTTFNGHRWETPRITLDVTHGRCSDGMSDRIYADTTRATVDGRELRGCGGAILAPDTLAGTSWSIVEIDGLAVSGDAYHVQFEADRISGQAGCNRFSGTWSMSGDTLTLGPLAATRMACPGPAMEHEQRAFQVLQGNVRAIHPEGDVLVLSGNGGTIRLRRSI